MRQSISVRAFRAVRNAVIAAVAPLSIGLVVFAQDAATATSSAELDAFKNRGDIKSLPGPLKDRLA